MTLVAMAYRAFRVRFPRWDAPATYTVRSSGCLTQLATQFLGNNSICIEHCRDTDHRNFKPNDDVRLTRIRVYASGLMCVFATCGVIAQLIDDKESSISALALCGGVVAWIGAVVAGVLVMPPKGPDEAGDATELEEVKGSDGAED